MHLVHIGQKVGAMFNDKLRKRVAGLQAFESKGLKSTESTHRLLIHCASYGEFEQIKPLVEQIKRNHSQTVIIGSFFSPSGYEMAQSYEQFDQIVYLPVDTKNNMRNFINEISPDLVLVVKYEIWVNFIDVVVQKNIPIYLISGLFFREQIFFKWYGGFMQNALRKLTDIFVQDEKSLEALRSMNIKGHLGGDSRIDRVVERSKILNPHLSNLDVWCQGRKVLILGSIWPDDWNIFRPIIQDLLGGFKLIIAPHEFESGFLNKISKDIDRGEIKWSITANSLSPSQPAIILDAMGLLADIYRYGDIAYVGGGFKQGLHNIFEPAVHALPVLFGPDVTGHPEAPALVEYGGGFHVFSAESLKNHIYGLLQEDQAESSGERSLEFVLSSAGSSEFIYSSIKHHFN